MNKEKVGKVIRRITLGGFISMFAFVSTLTAITFFDLSSYVPESFWGELSTFAQDLFLAILGVGFAFLGKIARKERLKIFCFWIAIVFVSAFTSINYSNPAVFLAGIGALLNFAVMAFNKGKMPVIGEKERTFFLNQNTHTLASDNTKLKLLADHSLTLGGFSLGDILLSIGCYWITIDWIIALLH